MPRLQRGDRQRQGPRPRGDRRRPCRTRGRRVRRLGRPRRAGVESTVPGGQAAASSRIENFFGFPTGITGQALTGRALCPGAEVRRASDGRPGRDAGSTATRRPYALDLGGGAAGAAHDRDMRPVPSTDGRPSPNLAQFEGAGVYYAATFMEAQLARGEPVVVDRRRQLGRPGGGVPRRRRRERVHLLVRARRARRHDVALPRSAASRRTRRSSCTRAPSSRRSRATSHLERVDWIDRRGRRGRGRTRFATCS